MRLAAPSVFRISHFEFRLSNAAPDRWSPLFSVLSVSSVVNVLPSPPRRLRFLCGPSATFVVSLFLSFVRLSSFFSANSASLR